MRETSLTINHKNDALLRSNSVVVAPKSKKSQGLPPLIIPSAAKLTAGPIFETNREDLIEYEKS